MRTLIPSRRQVRLPGRKPAGRRPRAGFTLVELILAVMLLSFGMLALASSSVTMIRELSSSAVRTKRAALVATELERLRSFDTCANLRSNAEASSYVTSVSTISLTGGTTAVMVTLTIPRQKHVAAQGFVSSIPCDL